MTHGERVILCPSLTMSALRVYVDNMERARAFLQPTGIIEQSSITSSVTTQPFGLFRFIIN